MAFLEHVIVWEGKDIIGLMFLGVLIALFVIYLIGLFIVSKIENIKAEINRKKRLKEECEKLRRERQESSK